MFIEREKKEKREWIRGIGSLYALGGFIQEEIEDAIYDSYPDYVIEPTMRYCQVGPDFWIVLDEVEKACDYVDKYARPIDPEHNKKQKQFIDDEFRDWFINQVARITLFNVENGISNFWSGMDFDRSIRKELEKLNSLEDRVFAFSRGLGDASPMTAEQIAALEEFSCPVEYINLIIEPIEEKIYINSCSSEELAQYAQSLFESISI